ncbi:coiled-coil-like protein [Stemphylium lycopersici]|nr:hypothetical protein TW65_05249 [Stemphylium lycopersici]RAR08658.1 coiled-coil-like protein [Stemphylium lycopersici]
MALTPRSTSVHNQMITRFIKHPKSTNFDEQDPPAKRQKTGNSPKKAPQTPSRRVKRGVPDSDEEDGNIQVKEEDTEHKTDLESALPNVKTGDDAIKEYEAYKASEENKPESADERIEKRTWIRGKSSLYVDAFNLALDTVLDEESHLFNEAETEVFRIWRHLDYEAQYLKTSAWHRIKSLGYHSDISDLDAAAETLQRTYKLPASFSEIESHPGELEAPAGTTIGTSFTFADRSEEEISTLEEASSLLKLGELKALAKDAKVKGKNKGELLKALRRTSQKQTGLGYVGLKRSDSDVSRASSASRSRPETPEIEPEPEGELSDDANRDAHFTRRIMQETGSCIRLSLATLKLFERVHLVFYRSTEWTEKSLTTIILAKIARRNFPEYIVSRSANIFASRSLLLEYEASVRTQHRIDSILEFNGRPTEKGYQEIIDTFEEVYPRWQVLVQEEQRKEDSVYQSGEGSYLRRLSPAWVYTRIIHKALDVFRRRKEHKREHEIVTVLLDQRLFHHSRRGAWYQRKALLEEHYMAALTDAEKRSKEKQKRHWKVIALQTCEEGLQDNHVHIIYHYDLQKRITKLELSLNIPMRLQHDFSHVRLAKPVEVSMEGTRIERSKPPLTRRTSSPHPTPSRRGGKTIWLDPREDGECSVEAMCLSHYRNQGWKGYHSEGGIIRTLFAYLFFDVLFTYVPNVFQTPYQTCPLDLHTDAFYPSRISEINARLNEISNGDAPAIIQRIYTEHHERRTCVVGLDWSYDVVDLLEIARCFDAGALATVCKVMAQEYGQRGGGVPDLFLWRVGGDDDADIKNRSTSLSSAKEPATLMLEAIHAALADTSCPCIPDLQAGIDSIDVVRTWTWPYEDLAGLLAGELGVGSGKGEEGKKGGLKWKRTSEHGGDKPGKLFDEAAKRVASGECRVAVVTGGEALASLSAFAAAKQLPPPGWTPPSTAVASVFSPTSRDLGNNLGAIHGIGAPIHVYPLYENGFRAHRGQTLAENHDESAKLYAEFARVAEGNEVAWGYGEKKSEEEIKNVGGKNRMICYPYPLLMNAFNTVNLAAAIILTTTSHATTLGIPRHKWIYPLGGAGTRDADAFWQRPNFHSSPSIEHSLDACMHVSNTTVQDIDLLDIYSCFPIVPKLAAAHLGLPLTGGSKNLTVLGGLTFFGGAGNNYSMHALTQMTRLLRRGEGNKALVLCNGGVLSYQYAVVLGRGPREDGTPYPNQNPLPEMVTDVAVPRVVDEPRGEAFVETYTVEFARDGTPARGFVVGRLKEGGGRFLANHGDEGALRLMAGGNGEIVGRKGWVWQDGEKKGRSLFAFDKPAKL